jgi:hypothetical protein
MTGAMIREMLDVIMRRHQDVKDSTRQSSPEATGGLRLDAKDRE